MQVLALDVAGTPVRWLDMERSAGYYATGKVAWELGEARAELRGGTNRDGLRSGLSIAPIIAVRSPEFAVRKIQREPRLTNRLLFARDRHICAYCGRKYPEAKLSRDHIIPVSRGGRDAWMNVVCACRACNARKSNRFLEECGMSLLYVPYVPNRYEEFIVKGRNVLADQMEFLKAGVPRHSRMV